MILLDTNVVSELLRPGRHPSFNSFIRQQSMAELAIPSIVIAEVRFGIQRLPLGRRRSDLEAAFGRLLVRGFFLRIVDFDASCAEGYATARTVRMAAGRPVEPLDALIGATALAHGATLATRNMSDFDGYGLHLVNPWEAA